MEINIVTMVNQALDYISETTITGIGALILYIILCTIATIRLTKKKMKPKKFRDVLAWIYLFLFVTTALIYIIIYGLIAPNILDLKKDQWIFKNLKVHSISKNKDSFVIGLSRYGEKKSQKGYLVLVEENGKMSQRIISNKIEIKKSKKIKNIGLYRKPICIPGEKVDINFPFRSIPKKKCGYAAFLDMPKHQLILPINLEFIDSPQNELTNR